MARALGMAHSGRKHPEEVSDEAPTPRERVHSHARRRGGARQHSKQQAAKPARSTFPADCCYHSAISSARLVSRPPGCRRLRSCTSASPTPFRTVAHSPKRVTIRSAVLLCDLAVHYSFCVQINHHWEPSTHVAHTSEPTRHHEEVRSEVQ
jgi:hypothetical protein